VVVSDDLRMGAIEQHYGLDDAVLLALQAGVDVLLIADDRLPDGRSAAALALDAIRRALESGRLPVATVEAALARIDALRSTIGGVSAETFTVAKSGPGAVKSRRARASSSPSVRTETASAKPAALAMPARSTPRPVWARCMPVSP
jgi:beta-glucosidase-like glycosyl hydrolase